MKRVAVLIIFLAIGTGIYFNSLKNGFHYDDMHHIVQNSYIKTPGNIPHFFFEPRTLSIRSPLHQHYRPLVMTSYAVNYYLGGFSPRGYHMVNLAFHIGSAFLIFLMLQAMIPPHLPSPLRGEGQGEGDKTLRSIFIPLAAGLFFLTTPYNTEVVNYITARSTVMCTFFYLMAFYFWVSYRRNPPTPLLEKGGIISPFMKGGVRGIYYSASLLAFLLAMLTKEIAITLPVMLWLYDLYFVRASRPLTPPPPYPSPTRGEGKRGGGIHYLVYLPFAVMGGLIGIVFRAVFFRKFIVGSGIDYPFIHLLVQIKVTAKYFFHAAIPINLNIDHQIQQTLNIFFFLSLVLIIFLLVLSYVLWRSRDTYWRAASCFIVWFFIVLFPTSFVSLAAPYQENRGYLSAIGFVAFAAVGLERLIKRAVSQEKMQALLEYSLIGLLVLVCSIGVIQRNKVWLNDETLWSDVLKKHPENTKARLDLGNYYNRIMGQTDRALSEYQAVVDIDPKRADGYINMGIIYLRKGEVEKAEELFRKALSISPGSDFANFYMAKILQDRGDLPGAARHLLMAMLIRPDNLDIAARLIDLYQRMNNLDEAYNRIMRALKEDPDNPAVRRALGIIYMVRGNMKEAAREYETVIKYIPDDPQTLADLGHVYFKQGLMKPAEEKFKLSLSMGLTRPATYQGLGLIYQNQGKYDDALAMYSKVLEKSPDLFKVLNNMGTIYLKRGEDDKALNAFKMALEIEPSYHIARFNLGNLYENKGNIDLARKEFKKILKDTSLNAIDKDIHLKTKEKLAALK